MALPWTIDQRLLAFLEDHSIFLLTVARWVESFSSEDSCWIIGEVILLGPFALVWQLPFFVWGLAIFGLASMLWMSEYREQPFPGRPVSHA